jgi:hypothetical protein
MRTLRWRAIFGWGLLLGGFLWALMDVQLFPSAKFAIVNQSRLASGRVLTKVQTLNALRDLAEALPSAHREVLVPVSLMLVGGILLGARSEREKGPTIERTQP